MQHIMKEENLHESLVLHWVQLVLPVDSETRAGIDIIKLSEAYADN